MCGTVGLFLGCDLEAFCPRVVPSNPSEFASDPGHYRSAFRGWDDRATVRSAHPYVLQRPFSLSTAFPRALTPILSAPRLAGLAEADAGYIKVQQLYRFLDFTQQLEHFVVNRTALGAAHDELGFPLPEKMQLDAHRIYVDEGYHALFSFEMLTQVRRETGIDPTLPRRPKFLTMLHRQLDRYPEARGLIEILFVIVSETLITGALVDVAVDKGVDKEVSRLMRDHASDEGRHHAYFAQLAKHLWHALGTQDRRIAADVLPALILGFTSPEIEAVRHDLTHVGLSASQAEEALDVTYSSTSVAAARLTSATKTRQIFTELGVNDLESRLKEEIACAEW